MTDYKIFNEDERVKASKTLSHRLRHAPGLNEFQEQIAMDRAGYVPAADILNAGMEEGWLRDEVDLWALIEQDPKGRFEFSPGSYDEDEGILWHEAKIRACSGHSLAVDLGLERYVPTSELYFGTSAGKLDHIVEHGLTSGSRKHVRLLDTEATADHVAEQRRGEPAVFSIDAVAMHEDGFVFERAHNGEILTAEVPAGYLSVRQRAPTLSP